MKYNAPYFQGDPSKRGKMKYCSGLESKGVSEVYWKAVIGEYRKNEHGQLESNHVKRRPRSPTASHPPTLRKGLVLAKYIVLHHTRASQEHALYLAQVIEPRNEHGVRPSQVTNMDMTIETPKKNLGHMETRLSDYVEGRRLHWLLQSNFVTPTISTVPSRRDERLAHRAHVENVPSLWFLLAQATLGQPHQVLQGTKRIANPNGTEAWVELERTDGGRDTYQNHFFSLLGWALDI